MNASAFLTVTRTPTSGGEVVGEAEVEFATEMPADQEVEFAARVSGNRDGSLPDDGR